MSIAHMAKTFFAAVREGDGAIQTMMAANAPVLIQRAMVEGRPDERSEEHTSELQSLMRISYAVFCLKKKNETYTKLIGPGETTTTVKSIMTKKLHNNSFTKSKIQQTT